MAMFPMWVSVHVDFLKLATYLYCLHLWVGGNKTVHCMVPKDPGFCIKSQFTCNSPISTLGKLVVEIVKRLLAINSHWRGHIIIYCTASLRLTLNWL